MHLRFPLAGEVGPVFMSLLTTCIYLATCLLKIIVVIEFCIFSSFVDHISVLISKNSFSDIPQPPKLIS